MKKIILLSVLASSFICAEVKKLDEVTVTAQKIEENIKDVPISISTFDNISLEDKNTNDLNDLMYYTPNLFILGEGAVLNAPSIRGIYADPTTGATSSALYVDGVPSVTSVGFFSLMNDIERVEILRGPQGTLYGRNAQAGVINVITKKPTNIFEGNLSIGVGEDNKKELEFNIKSPLIKNKFFIGLSGKYYSKDGFMNNIITGNRVNDRKYYYGKVHLRATPNDNLEFSLISSLFKEDSGSTSQNSIHAKDYRKLASDIDGSTKFRNQSNALKIAYNLENFKIDSVTTYKKINDERVGDFDYSPKKIIHSYKNIPYETISEELKLSGKVSNFKWLTGLYFDKSEKKAGDSFDSDIPAVKKRVLYFNDNLKGENIGVFGHIDYSINNKLSFISGLRYDRDKKSVNSIIINESATYSEISPKFALNYKLNSDSSFYAQIVKGYKSGGFSLFSAPGYPKKFDKETLWNYELGYKGVLFDGKLNLNADIYYMDINDMQVTSAVTAQGGYVSNAASATSKGFEIETNLLLTDNITTFANFGYNETKYKKYSDFKGDYQNNYNPFAPKYSYSIGSIYRANNGIYTSADIVGYGKMYFDKENKQNINSYHLVNTKIGYEKEKFDIYLYAKNLFDKRYDYVGVYGGQVVQTSAPREIGLKLNYRF